MFKPRIFSTMLLAVAIALTFGARNASAQLEDPLHGYPGIDNGTNTPITTTPVNFGFTVSPGPASGDLLLDVLVPNNVALPASFSVTGTLVGTATKFSTTAWTSGFLDAFIGISASPANGIGAFLPSTQGLDPGATGFIVYQVDLGQTTLQDASKPGVSPLLNIAPALPLGSYIVGFLNEGTSGSPNWVATANSGALFADSVVPEPSTLAVATLGALGFIGYGLRRRLKK
jgi:hypothetical protein